MSRLRTAAVASATLAIIAGAPGASRAEENPEREAIRQQLYSALPLSSTLDPLSGFGQCVTVGDVNILHAPFQNEAEIDDFVNALVFHATQRYQASSRITTTATNGSTTIRNPITLTYSFVPDGLSIPAEASVPGSTTGPSNLFATMDAAFAGAGGQATWKAKFAEAFNRIGALTAINYVEVTDDGATFISSAGSNTPGATRGDIRISMRPFAGSGGVLAYNYFPNTSDMVIDSQDISLWTNGSNNYRTLRNTLMHEHGHGLGYAHVDPTNNTKLMEAFLNTNFDGPQQDDIRGLQFQYGDDYEANPTAATANLLGNLSIATPLQTTEASIETNNVVDVYAFDVADPAVAATITLTPVGTTYAQGPQGGSTANVNALAIHDLQFDVLGTDGSTILATRNSTGAGAVEELSNFILPSAGRFYVRVSEASTANDIQRYTLRIQGSAVVTDCNSNSSADAVDIADTRLSVEQNTCTDAQPIQPFIVYSGTTTGTSRDGTAGCGTSSLTPDVWYRYVPDASGTVTISLCGSIYDTVLSVHTSCSSAEFTAAACNDDATSCGSNSVQSEIANLPVTGGTTYFIRVSGFQGATGDFSLVLFGPDSLVGRSRDNNSNSVPDECEAPIIRATYSTFDTAFNYGELDPAFTSLPASLQSPTIPGFGGSAPGGTTEIGISSTAALNGSFATWRRNFGIALDRDSLFRVKANLRTDATLNSSNWVRLRFGGDFLEANGQSEMGFASNASALPTGSARPVQLYHWNKNRSVGTSAVGGPDQPALSFDLIDESPTIGGHVAAISSASVDIIARQALGTPTILRNKGIASVSFSDGFTPPSTGRTDFTTGDGYTTGVINDPGASVTMTASKTTPSAGAMNLTFASGTSGDQTGFAAMFVDPAVNPTEARIAADNNKLYAIDVWVSPTDSPNTTTRRPPILRLRWTAEQIPQNHGQIATSSFNLNPDPNFDGTYDNPSGLRAGGFVASRYTSFWNPSLNTTAQPNTNTLYFVDFLFNRTGTSAIKPSGTYMVERLVISEYVKPTF